MQNVWMAGQFPNYNTYCTIYVKAYQVPCNLSKKERARMRTFVEYKVVAVHS